MTIFGKVFGVGRRTGRLSSASRILWTLPLFALIAITDCNGSQRSMAADTDIFPANLWMFSPLPPASPVQGVAAIRVDLGRRLYYDTHLSANNTVSCNSCHDLAHYGADKDHPVSTGFNGKQGARNSPTVYNAVLQFVQFWDGRAPTLAAQASGPMMNPVEMGMSSPEAVAAVLRANPAYVADFKKAYPESKDPITLDNAADAIAQFEAGLLTPAAWDDYLHGNPNALTTQEKDGLRVFLRAGCASCHAGTGVGGNSYQKMGTARDWPDKDRGRFAITKEARDDMFFKVPLLRNVEQTGPWFHNGQITRLDEAVRLMSLYQTGHELNQQEIRSVVAFLHALTGPIPRDYVQPPSPEPSAGNAARRPTAMTSGE